MVSRLVKAAHSGGKDPEQRQLVLAHVSVPCSHNVREPLSLSHLTFG